MKRAFIIVTLIAFLPIIFGCGNVGSGPLAPPSAAPSGSADTSPNGSTAASLNPAKRAALNVHLRDGEGTEIYALKSAGDSSSSFHDAAGKLVCTLTFADRKLKVAGPDGSALCELKPKESKIMIKDASGENELFKFKLKGEDMDCYAPGDKRLYRIRKRDYGYRLEDNSDNTLFRAKDKGERIVLRNPDDDTVLACEGGHNPLGLVFFRIKELSPVQQAACFVFFQEH